MRNKRKTQYSINLQAYFIKNENIKEREKN